MTQPPPKEVRLTLLESIADRVPMSGRRSWIRALFFPASDHQLKALVDPNYVHQSGKRPPRTDWFEWVSLFMILVNSVVLAVSAPLQPTSDPRNQVSNTIDNILTVFFVFESALRITAFGSVLFSKDRWFVVDTVVVLGSSFAFIGSIFASDKGGFSLSGLRSFRLMKPIRSLRAIPAARVIIGSILASISSLQDVMMLTMMVMLLLGVGGVSQYNSRLVNRCVNVDYFDSPTSASKIFYPAPNFTKQAFIRYGAYERTFLANMSSLYTWATQGRNPNVTGGWGNSLARVDALFPDGPDSNPLYAFLLNSTEFDNITLPCNNQTNLTALPLSARRFYNCSLRATNTSFGNVSFPSGRTLFQKFLDAFGSSWDTLEFESHWKELAELPSWKQQAWQNQACNKVDALVLHGYRCPQNYKCTDVQNPVDGILGFDNLGQALLTVFIFSTFQQWFFVGGMMADAVDITSQLYFFIVVLLVGLFVINLIVAQMTTTFEVAYTEEKEQLAAERRRLEALGQEQEEKSVLNAKVSESYNAVSRWISDRIKQDHVAFDENDSDDEDDKRAQELKRAKEEAAAAMMIRPDFDDLPEAPRTASVHSAKPDQGVLSAINKLSTQTISSVKNALTDQATSPSTDTAIAAAIRDAKRLDQMGIIDPNEVARQRKKEEEEQNRIKSVSDLRAFMIKVMNSRPGLIFVSSVISANVVTLAMDYEGQPQGYTDALNIAALFFDVFFTVEVLTRWFAYGLFGYLRHVTNWIDFMVVFLSWLDVLLTSFNAPIIRALRLLRLYAVFKAFDELRLWLVVIRHAMKATLILAAVCVCALFIVACLGMQLFGDEFCNLGGDDARPDNTVVTCLNRPRSNFDGIDTALLSAFQIMTGDNWDDILYSGYKGYSPWSAFYFVAWYVVSNVVLVNLVIAIVLGARAEVIERESNRAMEREIIEKTKRDNDPEYQSRREEEEKKRQHQLAMSGKANATTNVIQLTDENENRLMMKDILASALVRRSILGIVFLGTLLMAFESPYAAPNDNVATVLRTCDIAICALFLAELLLKMLAHGVWTAPDSYLKQTYWNWVDVFVVLSGFVAALCLYWTPIHMSSQAQRLVGVFRTLRPLRFVCISQTLRDVLGVLARSIAPLRHLVVVIVIVFTFWGILGVQLFKGSFYSCSDPIQLNKTACLNASSTNRWVLSESHFNHLPAAYTTLFTVISLDGWTSIMWDGIDAVGDEQAFIVNYNPWAAMYFVSFVVVGNFFFLNLFVSVLIEGYESAKGRRKESGKHSPFLTPTQNAWIRSHHVVLNLVPQVDYDDDERREHTSFKRMFVVFRRHIRTFVRHPLFDVVVYCFIVVNFAVMAADRYPKSDSMALVVTFANTTFAFVFALELTLRIISDTPRRFFFYKWNQFDTLIVMVSLASLVMEYLLSSTTFASFFRTMRVLRLLRLLRKTRRLQIVLKRFVLTLVSLVNIAALIALLFVIFGLMGMKMFGRVAYSADVGLHSSFEDPVNALFMLMRMCTGGTWTPVMVQMASSADDGTCDPQLDNCGINVVAQLYFIIFISLGSFVVLNLFVAVVLDNFTADQEQDFGFLTEWEGGQLLQLWLRFDPDFTYRMESRFFVSFMRSIPKDSVLGVCASLPQKQRLRHELVVLESLRLTEYGGLIELQDVIFALCRRAYAFQKHRSDEAEDEWFGVERDDLNERQRERRWRPIELGILDSRRLDRKAEVWFRKDARDANRPVGVEYDVTLRFAVMILEQYWIQRIKTRRRNEYFKKRRETFQELVRLDLLIKSTTATQAGLAVASKVTEAVAATPKAAPAPTTPQSQPQPQPDAREGANATERDAADAPASPASPTMTAPIGGGGGGGGRGKPAAQHKNGIDQVLNSPATSDTAQPSLAALVQAHKEQVESSDKLARAKAKRVVATQAQLLAQQVTNAHAVREHLQIVRGGGAKPLSEKDLIAMGAALHRNNESVNEAIRLREQREAAEREAAQRATAAAAAAATPAPAHPAPLHVELDDDDAEFFSLL